jgi:hypothetical protein
MVHVLQRARILNQRLKKEKDLTMRMILIREIKECYQEYIDRTFAC